jgi:hypothetical protein
MPVPLKEKIDRVKEAVHLLTQLKDIGFLDTSQGYKDIKAVLDKWIVDGEVWSGKIKLPEYGRVADIVLTNKVGTTASLRLRSV